MVDRLVVLDTETTGIDVASGHRLIEVGCVELIDRRHSGRNFHRRVNPGRLIDEEARLVHGISNDDLRNEPSFSEIAEDFIEYVRGSRLVIHNAAFDLGFLNIELIRAGHLIDIRALCDVIDTLAMARSIHPGQSNSLNALSRRYGVDLSSRAEYHGALVDAALLADVYLAMTSGQSAIEFGSERRDTTKHSSFLAHFKSSSGNPLPVIHASSEEVLAHQVKMQSVHKAHLAALESKAKSLRSEVRGVTEWLSARDKQAGSAGLSGMEPFGSLRNARDVLRQKQKALENTEDDLSTVAKEGPRFL